MAQQTQRREDKPNLSDPDWSQSADAEAQRKRAALQRAEEDKRRHDPDAEAAAKRQRELGDAIDPAEVEEARAREEAELGLPPMKLPDTDPGFDPVAAHAMTLQRRRVARGEEAEDLLFGEMAQQFVKKRRDEVAALAEANGIVVGELYDFGLAFDVFDPQSGAVVIVCRPQRRDIGHQAIHKSAQQVIGEIIGIRNHRDMLARINA